MLQRFVLVPAIPVDREPFRVERQYYEQSVFSGFDIYDNREKVRLKTGFPDRAVGEKACAQMNAEFRNLNEHL